MKKQRTYSVRKHDHRGYRLMRSETPEGAIGRVTGHIGWWAVTVDKDWEYEVTWRVDEEIHLSHFCRMRII